jgi:hypothetical protein
MLWRLKQGRAPSAMSHFPPLGPSSQEALKEEGIGVLCSPFRQPG